MNPYISMDSVLNHISNLRSFVPLLPLSSMSAAWLSKWLFLAPLCVIPSCSKSSVTKSNKLAPPSL